MDPFTLTCDKLPPNVRVMRMSGLEGLSQLYRFSLELVIPGDEGLTFDMEETLYAPATLSINDKDGTERAVYHGILSELDWVEEVSDHAIYRVVLVPRLWKLGLSQHGRVFPDKTLSTIIEEVLKPYGFEKDKDYQLLLEEKQYEKMPHVGQCRESDLAFLMRRMERDGVYFFFEQLGDREKLVITDNKKNHKPSGSVSCIPQSDNDTIREEAFTRFVGRYQANPKLVRLREYDYLRPDTALKKEQPVSSLGTAEVISHDDHYSTDNEGGRLALVRAEELKARQAAFAGHGHTFNVRPGFIFDLSSHPRPSFIAKYLAVAVEHEGTQGVLSDGTPEQKLTAPTYMVRVEAIPEGVQYRPPRVTPVPRIYGTEIARVDGEQDSPYAQIDEHGRYKVQLYFDETPPRNGKASTWIRMLQPHGGPNEGFHFPLRKHTEVLLVFLGGDPDRPVIAGVVPNTNSPSPVTSHNASQNVIHTGGNTRLEIEDNDGGQYLKITTPPESTLFHLGAKDGSGNNVHLSSMGDGLVELGGNLVVRVDGSKTEEIHQDVTETYSQKQTTSVSSDKKLTVGATDTTEVTGNQTLKAKAKRLVQVTSNQRHEVGGNDEHAITGNHSVQVTGNQTNKVTGSQTINVTSSRTDTVTGTYTQTTGPQTLTVNGPQTSTINGPLTQTITGGATITSPAGYRVVAPSSWFKVTGASGELVGVKIGIVAGLKTDHALIAITGGGMKLDTLGLKLDLSKVAYKNNPMTITQATTKLKMAAIGLYMYSMTIFS